MADSALLKYYLTSEQYVDVPIPNTEQEFALSVSSCKQWAEIIYYPSDDKKSERTAQVTTKLMLLLAQILTCPAGKAESVYADIMM